MVSIGSGNRRFGSAVQVLAILLVVSALSLTLWFKEGSRGPLHMLRSGASYITTPISVVGSYLTLPFRAVGTALTNATASEGTLSSLEQENADLSALVMELEEYRLENQRLSALLELKDAYSMQGVGARVIARSSDSYNRTVTIDKGSDDGLSSGMPVMSADGLIGQVETANATSATVRLITDQSSGVSAMLQQTRVEGILNGSLDGLLYLNYVPVTDYVGVGDVIITSGVGGVYPKGIIIGEVISVEDKTGAEYHTIIVKSLSSMDAFEEVLVLTGEEAEVTYSGVDLPAAGVSTTTPVGESASATGSSASQGSATQSSTTGSTAAEGSTTQGSASGSTTGQESAAGNSTAAGTSDTATGSGEGAAQ